MKSLTYEEVEEEAGHGGHEVLNWVALSGAMYGQEAKLVLYEEVIEWICGMAYVDYEITKTTTNGVESNGAHTNGATDGAH